jgi:hypothetical protein
MDQGSATFAQAKIRVWLTDGQKLAVTPEIKRAARKENGKAKGQILIIIDCLSPK